MRAVFFIASALPSACAPSGGDFASPSTDFAVPPSLPVSATPPLSAPAPEVCSCHSISLDIRPLA